MPIWRNGRRTALKMRRSNPCRFKSGYRHQRNSAYSAIFVLDQRCFLYIIQESVRKINDKPRTKKVRKHCNAQCTGLFLITPAGRFDKTPRMVLEQYHPKIILKHFCVSANAVAVKCSYFAVIDGTLCSLPLAALWKMM